MVTGTYAGFIKGEEPGHATHREYCVYEQLKYSAAVCPRKLRSCSAVRNRFGARARGGRGLRVLRCSAREPGSVPCSSGRVNAGIRGARSAITNPDSLCNKEETHGASDVFEGTPKLVVSCTAMVSDQPADRCGLAFAGSPGPPETRLTQSTRTCKRVWHCSQHRHRAEAGGGWRRGCQACSPPPSWVGLTFSPWGGLRS